jgi:hypothetical protein
MTTRIAVLIGTAVLIAALFCWAYGIRPWLLFARNLDARHAKPHGDDTPDADALDRDDPDSWPVDEETAERASMARLRGEVTETYPAGHGAQGDPATAANVVHETPGRVPAFVPAPIRNGGWEPDDGTLGEEWDRIHPRWREHRELDPAIEEVAHGADGLKALPQLASDDTDVPRPGQDVLGDWLPRITGPGHPELFGDFAAYLEDVPRPGRTVHVEFAEEVTPHEHEPADGEAVGHMSVPRPGAEPSSLEVVSTAEAGPGHPELAAVPVAALHDVEECPGGCRAHLRVLSPPVAALVRDKCDGFGDTDLWVDWFAMQVAVAA